MVGAFRAATLRVTPLALAAAFAIMLGSCGESEESVETPLSSSGLETPLPSPGLVITLEVGLADDPAGSIPLALELSNPGTDTVKIDLGGQEVYGYPGSFDFFVTADDGRQVWHWLDSKPSQLVLSPATLSSGQKMVFEGEWDRRDDQHQTVAPGVYHVYGTLRGVTPDNVPFSLRTETEDLEVGPDG